MSNISKRMTNLNACEKMPFYKSSFIQKTTTK